MKSKRRQTDLFDILAYLLMSLFIILMILMIVRGERERLLLCLGVLLILCLGLALICLWQRRIVKEYRELQHWIREGDMEDRSGLPEPLREQLDDFFALLDQKYSYENLKSSMEYMSLQNQINPHFLYNTLDAIRSQALSAGETQIADMTGRLSRFYRYSIRNRGDLVPLSEEVHNVEDYFAIQQYRFENRFSLEILCSDPDILRCYIPKMTFQPLVENALCHGLERKKGEGKITLRIDRLGKSLHIVISDDGMGMDEETLAEVRKRLAGVLPEEDVRGKHTGIAIYNVNRRLQILFGDSCGLEYSSVPGLGTDVEIRIPLVTEENRGELMRRM